MVVLLTSFWPQSTSTLPVRADLVWRATTSPGSSRSSSSATALAKPLVCAKVASLLSGR